MTDTPGTLEERLRDPRYCGQEGMRAEAADEIASLRARVEAMEAENERLTKAVGSGILGELLNDEETDEFVNFIKFLRSQALKVE